MPAPKSRPEYTIEPQAVRRAIDQLVGRRSHEHLPAYLAILRQRLNAKSGRVALRDIEEFYHEYMRVPDAPTGKPFLQPFLSRGNRARLLNKNLQGSFAPSSIRPGQPLSHVVELPSQDGRRGGHDGVYKLVDDHADKVLSEMLSGNKILSASIAIFLFRDRSVILDKISTDRLSIGLIPALREFLKIRSIDKNGDHIYNTLFDDDTAMYEDSDFARLSRG